MVAPCMKMAEIVMEVVEDEEQAFTPSAVSVGSSAIGWDGSRPVLGLTGHSLVRHSHRHGD